MGCTALENPIISKGVKSIGTNAFADCTSITAFEVSGENQTFVSKDGVIFTKDEKELVMYPSGKTDAEYTIPSGTERIREKAFAYNSNVEKINIPDSLRKIGDYAFYFCDGLRRCHHERKKRSQNNRQLCFLRMYNPKVLCSLRYREYRRGRI